MNRRMARSVCFLATAFVAQHGAAAETETCKGSPGSSEGGFTTVIRSGAGHIVVLDRTDPDGTIHLEQHGEGQSTLAVQDGSGGRLAIDQRGAGNATEVTQGGACNGVDIAQSGEGNRAVVVQGGSANRVVVRQGQGKE